MRAPSILAVLGFSVFALFSYSLKREMWGDPGSQLMIQRGVVAPNFQATDMHGNRLDMYEVSKVSKPVLVIFWATWCDPCRVELANLQRCTPAGNQGMEFLAVNLDPPEIQNFPFVRNLPFPVLLDPDHEITKLYRVRSIPSTLVVRAGDPPRVQAAIEGPYGAQCVARMLIRQ